MSDKREIGNRIGQYLLSFEFAHSMGKNMECKIFFRKLYIDILLFFFLFDE